MKSPAAAQAERSARLHLAKVDLVRIKTYTDRAAATVDETFYFASRPASYQWADEGSAVQHLGVIAEIGDLAASMNHLPSGDEQDIPTKDLELRFSNATIEGETVYAMLRTGTTIENATVELVQVLVDDHTGPQSDLSSETGTPWWSGRVRQFGPADRDTVALQCSLDMPQVGWLMATVNGEVDPRDIGSRYPIVYGQAKRVPAINRRVGWVTTVAEEILAADTPTTLLVSDSSGLETAGSATLGSEVFAWTGSTGNQLTGVTRGVNSTYLGNHLPGDAFVEIITDATFIVAGHAVSAIGDVYVRNPFNGEIVRLDETQVSFTKTTSDTAIDSGETVASVSFTEAELRATILWLSQSAQGDDGSGPALTAVQQPVYVDTEHTDERENHWAVADGVPTETEYPLVNESTPEAMFVRFYDGVNTDGQTFDITFARVSGTGDFEIDVTNDTTQPWDGTNSNLTRIFDQTYSSGTTEQNETITLDAAQDDWHYFYMKTTGSLRVDISEIHRVTTLPETITNATFTDSGQFLMSSGSRSGTPTDCDEIFDGSNTSGWNLDSTAYELRLECSNWDHSADAIEIRIRGGNGGSDDPPTPTITGQITNFSMDFLDSFTGDPARAPVFVNASPIDQYDPNNSGDTRTAPASTLYTFQTAEHVKLSDSASLAIHGFGVSSYITDIEIDFISYAPVAPTVDVAAANVGYGLELFVDVDGYVAPSDSPVYKAGTGNLMEDPADILRHWIEAIGGATIDATTYDALHTAMAQQVETWSLAAAGTYATTLDGAVSDVDTIATCDVDFTTWPFSQAPYIIESEIIASSTVAGGSSPDYTTSINFREQAGTTAVAHSDAVALSLYATETTLPARAVFYPGTTFTIGKTALYLNISWLDANRHDGFPTSGEGTILADATGGTDEDFSWTGWNENPSDAEEIELTGVIRGINGTPDQTHNQGALVVLDEDLVPSPNPAAWAGDVRGLGLTWREVAARMAYEARCNLWPEESSSGQVWKMLAADTGYDFGASVQTLTEWAPNGVAEMARDIETESYTRWAFVYDFDATLGTGAAAFKSIVRGSPVAAEHDFTEPTDVQLDAIEDLYGRLDSPLREVLLIHDGTTADHVLGYYVNAHRLNPKMFAVSDCPWWEGYTLEPGDIVTIQPAWLGASVKCRVIETIKSHRTEQVRLTLLEVT